MGVPVLRCRSSRGIMHRLQDGTVLRPDLVFLDDKASFGSDSCLTLFQDEPRVHLLMAEHLLAGYPVTVHANGIYVDEWQERPGKPDNDWLDCLVGCLVALSYEGCALPSSGDPVMLQRRKRAVTADTIKGLRYA